MKLMRMVCVAGALALGASTAFADKPAPPPAMDPDIQAFLKFFDSVADEVIADKADCAKMAVDVNKTIDSNKAVLDKAKAAQASGKRLPPEARNHMMETAKRMGAAMMEKCDKDTAVQAAFKRLPKHGPPARH
jgi:hypothetical protein